MRTGSSRNFSIESWQKDSRTQIEPAVLTQSFCNAWRAIKSIFPRLIRGSIISAPVANVLESSIGLKWLPVRGGGSESFCMLLQRALFSPAQDSSGGN
jgi:hypothetical protein